MLKVSVNPSSQFVEKALKAHDTLYGRSGAGNDFLGWLDLPANTGEDIVGGIESVVADWKSLGVEVVVCIGIGGSYLGAKATIEALQHSFAASMPSKAMQIVYAGHNLSELYHAELFDYIADKNVACVVISKSGTTTEPAVAFRAVKGFLEKKYGNEASCRRIVAVTDAARGALKTLATEKGYRTFVIPDNVGGRYSVLTPVGLLPIALAGFDIRALLAGAASMAKVCEERKASNPAVLYAAARQEQYASGKKIEILVNFVPKLQYVAEWWKQLYGESEGKDGVGIFPASVGFTTDLHSMGQYIQEGERTLFETVISVSKAGRELVIENDPANLDGLNFLTGKHFEECNLMAQLGTRLAHQDGGVPTLPLEIEKIDEFNLGELFFFFEAACGISAYTMGINPFNQPGVEAYKKNMFALLGKPGYEDKAAALLERLK
ncbi:MAG: glucose-6-phosphate isomerase [Bacteroidales bacterium]|nr:glucose-6-phosphate isomerase [Bacteroidales bacterium]